jgi:hypothetical protein
VLNFAGTCSAYPHNLQASAGLRKTDQLWLVLRNDTLYLVSAERPTSPGTQHHPLPVCSVVVRTGEAAPSFALCLSPSPAGWSCLLEVAVSLPTACDPQSVSGAGSNSSTKKRLLEQTITEDTSPLDEINAEHRAACPIQATCRVCRVCTSSLLWSSCRCAQHRVWTCMVHPPPNTVHNGLSPAAQGCHTSQVHAGQIWSRSVDRNTTPQACRHSCCV